MSIPFTIAAIVMTTILGRGITNMMIALITFNWMSTARLMRSQVLSVKGEEFVQAARALGASDLRIIFKHVILNTHLPCRSPGFHEHGINSDYCFNPEFPGDWYP